MTERPILFSDAMVRAILEGRKTQTRRVLRSRRDDGLVMLPVVPALACPYGVPGDRLWVREAWARTSTGDTLFRARGDRWAYGWKPSIHMPRRACRLVLEVTEVRVERLQAITEDDARAEGVTPYTTNTLRMSDPSAKGPLYRPAFEELWDSINGERAPWSSNPWVWAISFRRAP